MGPSGEALRIDPAALSSALGLLVGIADRLGGGARGADGRVRSVLGHGWSGGAASSFHRSGIAGMSKLPIRRKP
ncbi:hypothetical protein [Mycobacteroides abscessus]|uniref:hypothetical protein n=1 Tax=Mycobacteroides abscessus TaxID=36809 RepID=UPI0011C3E5FB|nr:hypothetical protein [Mycobacteroides abscessus]